MRPRTIHPVARRFALVAAALVAAAGPLVATPAQAGMSTRLAVATGVQPTRYGSFVHGGVAEGEPPERGMIYITAACEVRSEPITTTIYSETRCSIRDVTTGVHHLMFSSSAGIVGAGGAGTYLVPESHEYELCVKAWHEPRDGVGTPFVTSIPCVRLV